MAAEHGARDENALHGVKFDIAHFFSRPLVDYRDNQYKKIEMLDIRQEQRDLVDAIKKANRAVRFRSSIATVRSFGKQILHFANSCWHVFWLISRLDLSQRRFS
jgi:hypothetical protein